MMTRTMVVSLEIVNELLLFVVVESSMISFSLLTQMRRKSVGLDVLLLSIDQKDNKKQK